MLKLSIWASSSSHAYTTLLRMEEGTMYTWRMTQKKISGSTR